MIIKKVTVEEFERDFSSLTSKHGNEVRSHIHSGRVDADFEAYKQLEQEGYALIVAAYDGEIPVGYVGGTASPLHYMKGEWYVSILGMYTAREYRGNGIAKRIMAKYEKECKKVGITTLHLTIVSEETGAKAVVDALGMEYLETTYAKRL